MGSTAQSCSEDYTSETWDQSLPSSMAGISCPTCSQIMCEGTVRGVCNQEWSAMSGEQVGN